MDNGIPNVMHVIMEFMPHIKLIYLIFLYSSKLMTDKLNKLFKQTKSYGNHTRSNKLDGLKQWNKLKSILLESSVKGDWTPEVKTFFVEMRSTLKLQECADEIPIEDATERKQVWEKHHFYLQHARIPTLNFNDGKLVRLIQIAYNAGQLEALYDDPFYNKDLKTYYESNNLDKIETYMDKENLIKLNDSITDEMIEKLQEAFKGEQSGGNKSYEYKYIKYKNKYLKSKQNKH